MVQRPPAGTIPDAPGSYQFKDAHGRVIYVGKAKSLRQRLSNYFQNPRNLAPRTAQMVATAESVEWIQVRNDVEALMLEYSLIKQHQPRFNIRLRDDKSYPFLAVTLDDEWPRATVMRGAKRKGTRYFGPYAHAWAIRETLDLLLRTFPIRTCSQNKFNRHAKLGRPCLLFHIEKCTGPCVGEIAKPDYDDLVDELVSFLDGDTDTVIRRLEAQMAEAASELEFERAARVRDRLGAVRQAIEKQQMVVERSEDLDVIGLADDELEAAVQVFFVRRGRVVGRKGFVVDKAEDVTPGELVDRILEGLYADPPPMGVPKQVLVPTESADPELYEEFLGEVRGSKVAIRVPQRGDKRELMAMVTRNAEEELVRHRLRRASDHNTRARALNELQQYLDLPEAPLRIECYDMSHIQGSDYVGSMVVLEDGLPKKSEYRRFKIRSGQGNDDFAAMEEVLTRRLRAYLEDREKPVTERGGKFSYPPQLLLVDGGKGQLSVVVRVLEELGLDEEIPVASLAKQFEEVYRPGDPTPMRVPRGSDALYLLQRIRDEAHRFAISYHRQLRGKRMTTSVLDGIPGLGPTRKARLVKELGGVGAVKKASLENLKELSWLPDTVAEAVHTKIHGSSSRTPGPTVGS
ncbi:excinuclease ABC subunit UvrC [Rhabdothermincola salaria]|uniref:excinuclease ABC subunit UvrC n=1 Tax=Rhabdothermincola salaria TaxID=2903142 RepID=UPI001E3583A9|nr:excinuclease ABC subunit UvrC [Rhabdothermincola salaria]MCD9622593.1 excinuclease ABC subunit UvrC [Rhabdothermincola salaria]